MNQNRSVMKVAEILPKDVESINLCQSNIKTVDDKEVVLIAYEKSV